MGTQLLDAEPTVFDVRVRWWDSEGNPKEDRPFPASLDAVLSSLRSLLLRKNAHYGNSALRPLRVFSRGAPAGSAGSVGSASGSFSFPSSSDLIRVRIDDKLSRLAHGDGSGETARRATWDLMGYLVLLCIAEGWEDGEEKEGKASMNQLGPKEAA